MKTARRHARVGERVVIIEKRFKDDPYSVGDIFEVTEVTGVEDEYEEIIEVAGEMNVHENFVGIGPEEYEVITEEDEPNAENQEA